MYQRMIIEATGCSEEDAAEIEELMRVATGGTLDHLPRNEFDGLARVAQAALGIMEEVVPRG